MLVRMSVRLFPVPGERVLVVVMLVVHVLVVVRQRLVSDGHAGAAR